MLSKLLLGGGAVVLRALIGGAFEPLADIFKNYNDGKITAEQAKQQTEQVFLANAAKVEESHADSLAKTYASFTAVMVQSRLVRALWAIALAQAILTMFWYAMIVPGMVALGWIEKYPSAGMLVDWNVALVFGLLGLGAIAFRAAPGANSILKRK